MVLIALLVAIAVLVYGVFRFRAKRNESINPTELPYDEDDE